MACRRNRGRRRRHLRANLGLVDSESSPLHSSDSSSHDRAAESKTPLPNRQPQFTEKKPDLPRTTRDARAVRSFLLGLIRGYYIDAISRLPAAELRTTLARGFLIGGHCYGPLHPVHNIILNSVWYAAAFPFRADPIDVDVITTEGISRLSRRSLDGLVAYLCHQCPDLSHDDALWHLALADFHGASASARGAVPIDRTRLEAVPFQVAAQAARHPKASALAHFVTSVLPSVERNALSLLGGRRRLSSHDILRLSAMLQPVPLPDTPLPQPCPRELTLRIGRIIDEKRRILRDVYQTLLDIADAALRKFARQTGARYCLHTIYGHSIVRVEDGFFDRYYHINFMAWPKGKQSQGQTPVHFFAEAHNPPNTNCSEEDITFCCMLVHTQPSPSHVDNCFACARSKKKIDHPNGEEHYGAHPHKTDVIEDDHDCQTTFDVDYRFFDPDKDIDLVKWYADSIACGEAIYSKLGSKNANVNGDASASPNFQFAEDDDDDFTEDDDDDDEDYQNGQDDQYDKDIAIYCRISV